MDSMTQQIFPMERCIHHMMFITGVCGNLGVHLAMPLSSARDKKVYEPPPGYSMQFGR